MVSVGSTNLFDVSGKAAVSVAPLVLLSVVDHYERIIKSSSTSSSANSKKRVVGVILGDDSSLDGLIKVTNSFAIPFEEDEKNPEIWFLDHNFIESMLDMFRKINAKEKLIGWYHSGPKLKSSDLKINEIFKRFTPSPLLLIVDVNSTDKIDIPTDCYRAIEEIKEDGYRTLAKKLLKDKEAFRRDIRRRETDELKLPALDAPATVPDSSTPQRTEEEAEDKPQPGLSRSMERLLSRLLCHH